MGMYMYGLQSIAKDGYIQPDVEIIGQGDLAAADGIFSQEIAQPGEIAAQVGTCSRVVMIRPEQSSQCILALRLVGDG